MNVGLFPWAKMITKAYSKTSELFLYKNEHHVQREDVRSLTMRSLTNSCVREEPNTISSQERICRELL